MDSEQTKPSWQPRCQLVNERPAAIYIKCDISATHRHISGTGCIKDDIVSVYTAGSKPFGATVVAANFFNAWADKICFFSSACSVQLQSAELQIIVQAAQSSTNTANTTREQNLRNN